MCFPEKYVEGLRREDEPRYKNYGYQRDDMVILTDDQQNSMAQPTRANIIRAMHWLVKDAKRNDSLFIHFSGHGGQTKNLDNNDTKGYDEIIYPVDFRKVGHIRDDEMHHIMVQPLEPGVRLTAIYDSTHTASALDLPYIYATQGILKEPNLPKEASQRFLDFTSNYRHGDSQDVARNLMDFFKKATTGEVHLPKPPNAKTPPADVIMWSFSKDKQA